MYLLLKTFLNMIISVTTWQEDSDDSTRHSYYSDQFVDNLDRAPRGILHIFLPPADELKSR